jgi:hypothetical protein
MYSIIGNCHHRLIKSGFAVGQNPGAGRWRLTNGILSFKAEHSVLCIRSVEEISLPKGFLIDYRREEGNG